MVGPVSFVRTVLGDIDPSELGVTYAHEHLVIDGGRPVLLEPDFDLSDVDAMAIEVRDRDGARTALRRRRDAVRRRPQRRRSWPSSRAGPASTSSHRPDSTTIGSTGPPIGATGSTSRTSPSCSSADIERRDRRARLLGPRRPADGPSRRGHQGRRQRRRAVATRSARVRGGRRRPIGGPAPRSSPIARPAAARSSRSRCSAMRASTHRTSCSATSTRSSIASTTATCWRRCVRRVRPVVPLGRRGRTGRSSSWAGWPRTGCSIGSSSGWMPRDRATTASTAASPGLGWLLDGFTVAMEAAGLDVAMRSGLFVANPARAFAFASRSGGDES